MPVCQHFLKGRCKYGDRCYNEHPGKQTVGGNKFAALSGGGGGGGGGRGGQNQQNAQYGITAADIKADLTPGKGLPEWIFSCYGPGRDAPRQLFGGPQREQSFEELRLRHYELVAQGSPIDVAVSEAQGLHNEARNQMENALRDLDGAVRYILDGAKEHPNRIDIVNNKTGPTFGAPPKLFGEIKAPPATGPAFGEPALLGDQAYAKPSIAPPMGFGQPSNLAHATSFGQPSAFNQGSSFGKPSAQSAFGQPSFGQPASGFGQPSAAGATASPFSKASGGFGASASTPSPFAQFANAKSGGSTFGQPSASPFGSAQPSNPFGQPIPSSGVTNQRPAEPAFGQSGFAQLGQQASAARPAAAPGFGAASTPAAPGFGTPAAPGFGAPSAPGFGTASTPAAPGFGTASTPAAPGFGTASTPATSGFGAASTPATSGFGAASKPAPTGFGIPTTSAASPAAPAAPTAPLGPGPAPVIRTRDPSELSPIPPLNGQTIRDPMTRRLTSWKGQPVRYINDVPCYLHPQDRETFVRIFFPDGPPDEASLRDAQARPEEYTAEVTRQYEYFVTNGCFENGVIPSVPPKTEWVSFDF